MPKTRVAIAGLGRAAKAIHIPALRKLPDVSVIGGYDPVPQKMDFPVFASLDELLALKPEIVVIATPPAAHLAVAVAALQAGAHVFCEKPLANSVEEADEIAIEGEESQVILDGETFRAGLGKPILLKPAPPLSFVRIAA